MRLGKSVSRQAMVITVVVTLVYCLNEYHSPFQCRAWDNLLFYFFIPFIAILILRQDPLEWGLGIGHWQWTVGSILVGAAGVAILLFLSSYVPALCTYYRPLRPEPDGFWRWFGLVAVELFAWEFLWRAFMLFGLEPAFGELAIYVQMIPFAIAHVGKPEAETLSSIAGGILIGYLVRKCRSFWPAFFLHLCLYTGMYFI